MAELLSTIQTAWLLGGVAIGVWHEWWRRTVEESGSVAA
jgi:hypothetical protein